MNRTKIEWCDFTWNPIVGCTHGCPWCYARRMAKRQKHRCQKCYDFVPHLHPERLDEPSKVKKPSRIFVCSMGELFDPCCAIRDDKVAVLNAMSSDPRHTYIILTKRPDIALQWLRLGNPGCPHPNWWPLTSITNQADADKRIPEILKLKEAGWPVVGVSIEPLLGPVDLSPWNLDWVIIGAQTGPRAVRPDPAWVERISIQCWAADVPLFVKDNVGWPQQIREFPKEKT